MQRLSLVFVALALLGSTHAQMGFGDVGVWTGGSMGGLSFEAFVWTSSCSGESTATLTFLHMVRQFSRPPACAAPPRLCARDSCPPPPGVMRGCGSPGACFGAVMRWRSQGEASPGACFGAVMRWWASSQPHTHGPAPGRAKIHHFGPFIFALCSQPDPVAPC